MFDYDVMTEEQAQKLRFSLLPDGIYKGKIVTCHGRMSSTNNYMFDMVIRINHDHVNYEVKEFLSFSPKMMWKVIRCMKSVGLVSEYEAKSLSDTLMVNRDIMVLITSKTGEEIPPEKLNGKPAGSKYPDKNIIIDYIEEPPITSTIDPKNDFINDEIPF